MTITIITFIIFLLIFLFIGILSTFFKKKTAADYLLASQNVNPFLAAISAVATCLSGYMFIGLIGFTYIAGLSSMWIMFGWIVGDYISSIWVHKKVRIASGESHVLSFGGVLSKWNGVRYSKLQAIIGILTIVFLAVYAAAQIKSGSKALYTIFGWDMNMGVFIGTAIVLLYSFIGGIRASIWTDAIQAIIMMFSICLLFFSALFHFGGLGNVLTLLNEVSPTYMNWFPNDILLHSILFVGGWIIAGLGVVGQPHIMLRFMTVSNPSQINKMRFYYYSFYVIFTILAIFVGLISRLLLTPDMIADPELALPMMSQMLLPEIAIGIILAGLFAASMSTADSQIITCSAAISQDFSIPFFKKNSYISSKIATVFITLVMLIIALKGSSSVFTLVVVAWSVFSATLAPLIFVFIMGFIISERVAIAMIATGLIGVIGAEILVENKSYYNAWIGILMSFGVFLLSYLFNKAKIKKVI